MANAGRPARLVQELERLHWTDVLQELAAQVGVVVEEAAPERRHRARAVLLDAAHLRAQVRRLETDGDAARLDQLDERVGDLLAHPLLHREAARVEADESRQLRDADDLVARDVRDVRGAVERQRVMLAQRVERDRAFDDQTRRPRRGARPGTRCAASDRRRIRRSRRTARAGTARRVARAGRVRGPCRARRGSRPRGARGAPTRVRDAAFGRLACGPG